MDFIRFVVTVIKYPYTLLGIRNQLVYLYSETSIKEVVDNITIRKIEIIFREAE